MKYCVSTIGILFLLGAFTLPFGCSSSRKEAKNIAKEIWIKKTEVALQYPNYKTISEPIPENKILEGIEFNKDIFSKAFCKTILAFGGALNIDYLKVLDGTFDVFSTGTESALFFVNQKQTAIIMPLILRG